MIDRKLGLVVYCKSGWRWVYVGYCITRVKTSQHIFVAAECDICRYPYATNERLVVVRGNWKKMAQRFPALAQMAEPPIETTTPEPSLKNLLKEPL